MKYIVNPCIPSLTQYVSINTLTVILISFSAIVEKVNGNTLPCLSSLPVWDQQTEVIERVLRCVEYRTFASCCCRYINMELFKIQIVIRSALRIYEPSLRSIRGSCPLVYKHAVWPHVAKPRLHRITCPRPRGGAPELLGGAVSQTGYCRRASPSCSRCFAYLHM
jgi:hypothetical protein